MNSIRLRLIAVVVGGAALLGGAERPPIVGVANIAFKVTSLEAARNFYAKTLGFQEAFSLKQEGGKEFACFKVNDRQYIELSPELKDPAEDRLIRFGFETTDARKLRDYLASKGVTVPPALHPDPAGNLSFTVKDPEGYAVQFIQYMPKSLHSRNFGKFLSAARTSDQMLHVGMRVKDRALEDRFYQDILGFTLLWQGGPADDRVNWVSMKVPDGKDWLEYMLNLNNPTPRILGGANHAGLGVTDMQASYKKVVERGYQGAKGPLIGRDGRWLCNLYDADLTRAEFMVRKPVQTPCCSPMHDQ